jgi:hypothetical protein
MNRKGSSLRQAFRFVTQNNGNLTNDDVEHPGVLHIQIIYYTDLIFYLNIRLCHLKTN